MENEKTKNLEKNIEKAIKKTWNNMDNVCRQAKASNHKILFSNLLFKIIQLF